jgi:hypothetical protein
VAVWHLHIYPFASNSWLKKDYRLKSPFLLAFMITRRFSKIGRWPFMKFLAVSRPFKFVDQQCFDGWALNGDWIVRRRRMHIARGFSAGEILVAPVKGVPIRDFLP